MLVETTAFPKLASFYCDTVCTSCARGDTIMPPPSASWQYIRIYSPGGTCSSMLAI